MSIDNRIWVPAAARNEQKIRYNVQACDSRPPERYTPHQVFVAHGGDVLVDEQYFFEDEAAARWFWSQGYKECLYFVGEGPTHGYDRMALWVNNRLEAERSEPGS